MGFRYRCACCGEWQQGVPAVAFDRPAHVYGVPEEERAHRVKLNEDLCIIDDQYFYIRACLLIPIRGTSETFEYGVWSSLSETNFNLYRRTFQSDQSGLGPFFGWFANEIGGYLSTLSIRCRVYPQEEGIRPILELEETDHPLCVEYREGVTTERLSQIMAPFQTH